MPPPVPNSPELCPVRHSQNTCRPLRWLDADCSIALFRCGICTIEFLLPQPTGDRIAETYTADYFKAWGMAFGDRPEVADMKRATFDGYFDLLSRFCSSGRLLDVGTASGFLLDVAKRRGFDIFGIELSEYASNLAAAKFGADRIHRGTLSDASFMPGTFDVITMCDLLEHVPSPIETLRAGYRLLKPGGVLLVVTPDSASLSRRLFGRRWPHYKLEHLFYFNRESIGVAGEAASFKLNYFARARKTLTLNYVNCQMRTYRHFLLTPLIQGIEKIAHPLNEKRFRCAIGELIAIFQKPG